VFIDFEETGYNTLCHMETGTGKDRETMAEQFSVSDPMLVAVYDVVHYEG
jgi:hypothetical protein